MSTLDMVILILSTRLLRLAALRAARVDLEDAPLGLLVGQGELDLAVYSASANRGKEGREGGRERGRETTT